MSRNVGILGAGKIANSMAKTIAQMADVTLLAVASRSMEKAERFAAEYHIPKAYGSYEEMVQDEEIDLVYIATPHSHHFEHMRLCVNHGKNVLCEKAFTWNATEACEIKALAREKNVFVAEAIWTRYMPSRKIIDEVLATGMIGKISIVTCNLSYNIADVERIQKKELAGGALLDVGVYGLNFLTMHLGKDIDRMDSSVVMTETGVDGQESITIHFKNGIMGVTTHGIYGRSDRKGIFYGEKGYIIVENINNPSSINVYDSEDQLMKHYDVPEQLTGYEYQVWECFEQIEKGELESKSMPLDESIYMMQLMDDVKSIWER